MSQTSSMWFYFDGEAVKGPHSSSDLRDLKDAGTIFPDTQVCREGEETWIPLGDVAGLLDLDVHLAKVVPPPLPSVASVPQTSGPSKVPKKRVWFSKTQIAGLGVLAGFGLMRLASCSESPSSRDEPPVTETAPQSDDVRELNEKISQAMVELRSLGGTLLSAREPDVTQAQRTKLLQEAVAKATKIVPKLREISRYGTMRKWSSPSQFAFSSFGQVSPEVLVTELGFVTTMQSLQRIETDLRFFPQGTAVRF